MEMMSQISQSISSFNDIDDELTRKSLMGTIPSLVTKLSQKIDSLNSEIEFREQPRDISMRSCGSSLSDESNDLFQININEAIESLDALPTDIKIEWMKSFNKSQEINRQISKVLSDVSMGSFSFHEVIESLDAVIDINMESMKSFNELKRDK